MPRRKPWKRSTWGALGKHAAPRVVIRRVRDIPFGASPVEKRSTPRRSLFRLIRGCAAEKLTRPQKLLAIASITVLVVIVLTVIVKYSGLFD